MIDLVVALRAVTVAFDEAGLDYLVVGSGAAAAWGAARSTRDIDIAVVMDLAAFEVMLDHLSGDDFYVPELQAREAARSSGSFSVLHLATGGKIDDADAFRAALRKADFQSVRGKFAFGDEAEPSRLVADSAQMLLRADTLPA